MERILRSLVLIAAVAVTLFAALPAVAEPLPRLSLDRLGIAAFAGREWLGPGQEYWCAGPAASYALGKRLALTGSIAFLVPSAQLDDQFTSEKATRRARLTLTYVLKKGPSPGGER